ncbi:MAG: glycine zipper 2TM domain-containing protein [Rickettsiaceae bacterium]|nr:MAG: glycine zipper 2TM domain-containing protein [Rickettsiaceae bacterium]
MKLISRILIICLASGMLQGCDGNKQGTGLLAGAAAGGLLGSRFGNGSGQLALTGLGALAGALAGGAIGKSLDDNDKKIAALTSQKALETASSGSSVPWHNPDSGHKGFITPKAAYKNSGGQYCREYTHTVIIGSKEQQMYGTACRQPDGDWVSS